MAAGAVAETVAVELEQVASDVGQVAAATRRLDGRVLGSLWIGLGVGAAVGVYVGYKYSKKKLRNKIYAEAEQDIELIREHYQQKILAAEQALKPTVEQLVKDRGYVTQEDVLGSGGDNPYPETVHFPDEIQVTSGNTSPIVEPGRREVPAMVNVDPYLISEEEFLPNETGYAQVNYTYYCNDDVLVDDADPTNILSNREELLGEDAVKELAHAEGYGTIYVRNPNLQLEMLVEYVAKSWDEEVVGLDHEPG